MLNIDRFLKKKLLAKVTSANYKLHMDTKTKVITILNYSLYSGNPYWTNLSITPPSLFPAVVPSKEGDILNPVDISDLFFEFFEFPFWNGIL